MCVGTQYVYGNMQRLKAKYNQRNWKGEREQERKIPKNRESEKKT